MHHLVRLPVLCCLAIGCSTGCNQSPPATPASGGSVAIIDLDAVANRLGSDQQIASSLKQREAALKDKLAEMAQAYTEQLEQQKARIESDDQSQAVQLAQYQQQANQSLNTAKAKAQQDLTLHRSRLVQQFREAVRPAARRVADKRGMKVIVTRQQSLLFDFAPQCDITEEVIELMQAEAGSTEE